MWDRWAAGPALPASFSFAGGAAMRDGVYVVGGASHSMSVARLDRQTRVWHTLRPPAVSRVHCAVAALPDALFVLVPPLTLATGLPLPQAHYKVF